jgi:hypothetical protein
MICRSEVVKEGEVMKFKVFIVKFAKEIKFMFSKENAYQLEPIPIETHAEDEFKRRQSQH